MTRDDIIKAMDWHPAAAEHGPQSLLARVERVVQQAIAAEREACAKVCEDYLEWCGPWGQDNNAYAATVSAKECAAAIRARGQA